MHHRTSRWHTGDVPTTRPRHQLTETEQVARALDLAAQRWPGEPRGRLLLRLVAAGSAALEQGQLEEQAAHRAAVTASSGGYTDAYGPDYLGDLREDWPA